MGLAESWRDPEPPAPLRLTPPEPRLDLGAAIREGVRRIVDICGASTLIVLTAPLMALGIAIVLVNDGRPIFFGHLRIGRGGRPFRCWKIRTMSADAESRLEEDVELNRKYVAHGFKLPTAYDPRLLRGGGWLRRRYIDELPQLWNVLRGDMSLVGPRPVVREQLELFGDHAEAIIRHRPGLFGEWTSRGRARPPYPARVDLEMEYVNDPSLRRTAVILLRSLGAVLVGQGEEG